MIGRILLISGLCIVIFIGQSFAQRQVSVVSMAKPSEALTTLYLDSAYQLHLSVVGLDEETVDFMMEGATYQAVGRPGDYEVTATSELVVITAYQYGKKIAVVELAVQDQYFGKGSESVEELPEQTVSIAQLFSVERIDSLYTHLLASKMNLKASDIQVRLYDLVLARGKSPVSTFIIDLGLSNKPSLEPFREDAKPGDRLLIEAMEVNIRLESGERETINYTAYLTIYLK